MKEHKIFFMSSNYNIFLSTQMSIHIHWAICITLWRPLI